MGLRKALLGGKSDTSHFKAACARSDSLDLAKKRIALNHVQEQEFQRTRQQVATDCGDVPEECCEKLQATGSGRAARLSEEEHCHAVQRDSLGNEVADR